MYHTRRHFLFTQYCTRAGAGKVWFSTFMLTPIRPFNTRITQIEVSAIKQMALKTVDCQNVVPFCFPGTTTRGPHRGDICSDEIDNILYRANMRQ